MPIRGGRPARRGRQLVAQGAGHGDLRAVQELPGHPNPTHPAIYAPMDDDAVRRAAGCVGMLGRVLSKRPSS